MPRSAVILIAFTALLLGCNRSTRIFAKSSDSMEQSASISPVEGPSWLKHLGISMESTRMGQNGGTAVTTVRREPDLAQLEPTKALIARFHLTGADLYRMSCRSCHGPEGTGAPPEIHSLIGPVQATSVALIQKRMQARGAPITREMAAQMAGEAEKAIRDRLQHGGEKMPAFAYLRPEEVTALLSYLEDLAGVSSTQHVLVVNDSAAEVGEQITKGTCHICHDATGPGGNRMMIMMQGIIPSLASLPEDHSLGSMIRQVNHGTMGMMMMRGNRMPPFPYFTDPEITATYLYLQTCFPTQ